MAWRIWTKVLTPWAFQLSNQNANRWVLPGRATLKADFMTASGCCSRLLAKVSLRIKQRSVISACVQSIKSFRNLSAAHASPTSSHSSPSRNYAACIADHSAGKSLNIGSLAQSGAAGWGCARAGTQPSLRRLPRFPRGIVPVIYHLAQEVCAMRPLQSFLIKTLA